MKSIFSSKLLGIPAALIAATIAGGIDLVTSEVQPASLVIIASSGILGFLQPKRAWLWGMILGLSIFTAHGLAAIAGYRPLYPVEPNIFATLLALLPAFIGSYVGAAVRLLGKSST